MNMDEYREGYEDGVEAAKTPGADLAHAVFAMTDSPSYRKGWRDGYNGREFDPGEQGLFETDGDEDVDTEEEDE
jgi:hypothetical protein